MLTFDKLKLVDTSKSIRILDPSLFTTIREPNRCEHKVISMTTPCSLKLELSDEEAVLEFTGKVLGKGYPQLISFKTITECFDRINEMGFCSIDSVAMMDADVVKCDITEDIPVENIPEMTSWLWASISSHQKYKSQPCRNGNLIIEKNNTTKRRKQRLTIYDKELEMNRSGNREYVAKNELVGCYDGLCRFELNLSSKQQIRDTLNITTNTLSVVLQADLNPIRDFLEDAISDSSPVFHAKSKGGTKNLLFHLLLQQSGKDYLRAEAIARQFIDPRNTSIPRLMDSYRAFVQATLQENASCWTKEGLLSMLGE